MYMCVCVLQLVYLFKCFSVFPSFVSSDEKLLRNCMSCDNSGRVLCSLKSVALVLILLLLPPPHSSMRKEVSYFICLVENLHILDVAVVCWSSLSSISGNLWCVGGHTFHEA